MKSSDVYFLLFHGISYHVIGIPVHKFRVQQCYYCFFNTTTVSISQQYILLYVSALANLFVCDSKQPSLVKACTRY